MLFSVIKTEVQLTDHIFLFYYPGLKQNFLNKSGIGQRENMDFIVRAQGYPWCRSKFSMAQVVKNYIPFLLSQRNATFKRIDQDMTVLEIFYLITNVKFDIWNFIPTILL